MLWAKVAAAIGVVMILGAFAIGTEVRPSVELAGESYDCAAAIPSSWLVSGTPDATSTGSDSATDRGVHAACRPRESLDRWAVIGVLTVGASALLFGWAALRESPRATAPVRAGA